MQITFIGTGAADFNLSYKTLNADFRRRTTAMVNDDLLIDCSPDLKDYTEAYNTKLDNVKNVIITHTHPDHFCSSAVYENLKKDITIWAEKHALLNIEKAVEKIKCEKLSILNRYSVGGYFITAVPANHLVDDKNEQPVHYIISDGEKTVFWGCDGAWFNQTTWEELKKIKFDLMVFDGTLFDGEDDISIFAHNNIKMVRGLAEIIRKQNIIKPSGKIIISHLSRTLQLPHKELQQKIQNDKIIVAYDGYSVQV